MKTITYIFVSIFCILSIASNGQRTEFYPEVINTNARFEANIFEMPFLLDAPFYTMAMNLERSQFELSDFLIRFSTDKKTWTTWESFLVDIHGEDENISNIIYVDNQYKFYQLQNLKGLETNIRLDLFNPGMSDETSSNQILRGDCLQPPFKNRKAWCSSCTPGGSVTTNVTHLVVHHSAGTNESSDWDAVVRGIWNYHVNTRGWDDVGYNWLIAPDGTLYEGRRDNIQGAHYCGKNGSTMGTCMMGNYMEIPAKDTAMATLVKLLAWKADANNIAPLGSSYHGGTGGNLKNIIGHRDGCSTACPGDMFYPVLHNAVKPAVDSLVKAKCDGQVIVDPEDEPEEPEEPTHYSGPFIMNGSLTNDILDFYSGRKIIYPLEFFIVNVSGQIVMESKYSGRFEYFEEKIDVEHLPAGVYYVKLLFENTDKQFKFVKF